MGDKKQKKKNGNISEAFHPEGLDAEIPDSLLKQLKQSLDGFRQDLRFHPYVKKQKRCNNLKRSRIFSRLLIQNRPSVLAIAVLICIVIGISFFLGKNKPTWAEVYKHFNMVSFYSGSYYARYKSFFDNTKLKSFSDQILQSSSYEDTLQLEYWIGHDNRIRIINNKKVTFAKKGDFVKTFDLATRKESTPELPTIKFLEDNDFIYYGPKYKYSKKFDFNSLFLGRIDINAKFVTTNTEISKDLVIFDVQSDEGPKGQWKYRVWALRSSKLPIRILGLNIVGSVANRIDHIFNYSKEQPKEFFDPDIFETKMKDKKNSILSLMYMGLENNTLSYR